MNEKEFLKNLKAGDPVFVNETLCYVDHITPKGTIIVLGTKYDSKNGYSKGSDAWNHTFLYEATEERIMAYNKEKFIIKVNKYLKTAKMTYEEAKQIAKILNMEGI